MGIDVAPAQLSNGNGLNTPLVSWVQYAIISDSVAKFYDVSPQAVDWASMIYMLTYIPFILPASWMLDNKGLRCTVLLAGALNCLASWVKAASGQRDLYAVTMAGQTLAGITQAFILAVGNAVGFLVPPLIVSGYETMDDLGFQLRTVFYGVAGDAPLVPPSIAQARVLSSRTDRSSNWELLQSMRRMMRTPGFGLLVISYGISVGVYYAIRYLPLGFELAAELTYPEPEGTSAGLLNVSAQVFGLIFSELCGLPLEVDN
ncbi:hypothetical protein FOCC_FOCC009190, partial [Frankliniella occidentalis]